MEIKATIGGGVLAALLVAAFGAGAIWWDKTVASRALSVHASDPSPPSSTAPAASAVTPDAVVAVDAPPSPPEPPHAMRSREHLETALLPLLKEVPA